jgi:glycosyltransferase involved in cell wall biosynthesis
MSALNIIKMKMPLISVIIPVYNGEEFISRCIEALLNMDYPSDKFEIIIIVDNNSTDGTTEVVRRYPVRYIFESIKGPSAARNTGAKAVRENILAFTDVDVIVEKNWLFEIEKNFAIRKTVFLESGGFDNNFMSYEDVEFGLRLYNRGYKTVFSSGVKVNHINASELGTIINARREQSFYDYKVALRYDEESNKEYFPSLSRWRYKCVFDF